MVGCSNCVTDAKVAARRFNRQLPALDINLFPTGGFTSIWIYTWLRSPHYSANPRYMQRLFGLGGLLVFLVSSEVISRPVFKVVEIELFYRGLARLCLGSVATYFPVLSR
jgi:hypothetical protein